MDAAVGHQRNLVVNALSDRQPVQRVTKYGSDVLVESSASDEAHSTVCRRPNSVRRSAVQDRVAVVHLAVNQRVDESIATRRRRSTVGLNNGPTVSPSSSL